MEKSQIQNFATCKRVIVLLLVLVGLLSSNALGGLGDLDPTFSGDGKLFGGISHGSDRAVDSAVQPDGKIVVIGTSDGGGADERVSIARYNTDGSLDVSFGSGGKVIASIQTRSRDWAGTIAVQADGKIVIAADSRFQGYSGPSGMALMRYDSDGTLDTTFGDMGRICCTASLYPVDMAVQNDGKLVVAATSGYYAEAFEIVRLNQNGTLDITFGDGGRVATPLGERVAIRAIAIQTDGRIIAAGHRHLPDSNPVFTLVRYNPNGSLDPAFDGDGIVTTSINGAFGSDNAHSVAIQTDGKIVAAGSTNFAAQERFALVRYNPNGSLDTTFDQDGMVHTLLGTTGEAGAHSVVIQPDGKLLAAGYAGVGSDRSEFAVARYNPNGSLDTSFDSDGMVYTQIGVSNTADLRTIALRPGGKIVAVGTAYSGGMNLTDFALAGYSPDGSLDTSFDSDGKVMTDLGVLANNYFYTVAVQPDGKIVTGANSGFSQSLLIRHHPDGSIDTTFGVNGSVVGPGGTIEIQPDGKLLVLGGDVSRYNPDGSPDLTFGAGTGRTATGLQSVGASALQPDDKAIVGGTWCKAWDEDPFGNGSCLEVRSEIVRLNSQGLFDNTFDGDGRLVTNVEDKSVTAIATQSDGKILVTWTMSGFTPADHRSFVTRYERSGSLDMTFGDTGKVQLPDGFLAADLTIQADGKILLGGCTGTGGLYDPQCNRFALARYNANGTTDASFSSDGLVSTSIFDGSDITSLSSIALQPDGKILAAGYSSNDTVWHDFDFVLARYNTDGSLDVTFGGDAGRSTVDLDNSTDRAYAMALDKAGRAVVAGGSDGRFALARFITQEVTVSGRVLSATGVPIRNAVVTITDPLGNTRTTVTSSFGAYSFDNVLSGPTYTLRASAKRFRFQPRSLLMADNVNDLDLIADAAE